LSGFNIEFGKENSLGKNKAAIEDAKPLMKKNST